MRTDYDLIIAGAGPVGLAFAGMLAGQGLRIAVVEKQSRSVLADPPYDGREIALTYASWEILRQFGALAMLPPDAVSLIRHAKVINGDSRYALHFCAREAGQDHLGYLVSNHMIRHAVYKAVVGAGNIEILDECMVVDVQSGAQDTRVTLSDGRIFRAALFVAADSRFSKMRDTLKIPARKYDFDRICIVCRMAHDKDLDGTAYEYFGLDRTLAVLPLKNQQCSVVMTLPAEQAKISLTLDPDEFAADLARDLEPYCGALQMASERYAYPLIGVYADAFWAEKAALIGDAAVGMHPVTAHGFNLGLSGARVLADEILSARQQGMDIGHAACLRRYNRRHRRTTLPLYHGTNALVRLYSQTGPLSHLARKALLRLGNHVRPAKRMILNTLTDKRER